jgi:predicted RNase H-like HicB family nuclease
VIEYDEEYIVYAKRSLDDFQEETTSTNERYNDIENMDKTRSNIKELLNNGVVDKVDKGLPVPHKDYKPLDDIKKEYDTFFDEDSGNNSVAEALKEIEEYLKGEIDSLSESNINKPSDLNKSEDEPNVKKERTEEFNERDNTDLSEMPSFLDDID